MRFLADENFPAAAVSALIAGGHDVVWVRTVSPGIDDAQIMEWIAQDGRILLTFDKGFGELANTIGLTAPSGIILFRIPGAARAATAALIARAVASRKDWIGHFSVVSPGGVRMRRLGAHRRRP
jgi:predicted nuclease of predicted toxin-antitoxin system